MPCPILEAIHEVFFQHISHSSHTESTSMHNRCETSITNAKNECCSTSLKQHLLIESVVAKRAWLIFSSFQRRNRFYKYSDWCVNVRRQKCRQPLRTLGFFQDMTHFIDVIPFFSRLLKKKLRTIKWLSFLLSSHSPPNRHTSFNFLTLLATYQISVGNLIRNIQQQETRIYLQFVSLKGAYSAIVIHTRWSRE